jgi:murein DD-endopeptidase MepM/ murein hydrolase activator NlpD
MERCGLSQERRRQSRADAREEEGRHAAGHADAARPDAARQELFRQEAGRVDLGLEAPIAPTAPIAGPPPVRDLSLRWLSGLVATMVSGSALLGAAAYASLERRAAAETPQFALATKREPASDEGVNPLKGDRLVQSVDIAAARQTFRTPVAIKVGDREVVRQRAFTRVTTPLALDNLGFAGDVPAFNPMRLMGGGDGRDGHEAPSLEAGGAAEDADVSFKTVDLEKSDLGVGADLYQLDSGEALSQVDQHVRALVAAGVRAPSPISPQLMLMRTSRVGTGPLGALNYARDETSISAPFSSIEVRMVPENVTLIPKAPTLGQATQFDQRLAVIRRGETLEDVLRANAATREEARAIVAALKPRRGEEEIGEGAKLKLILADLGAGRLQIARVSAYVNDVMTATAAIRDAGDYVRLTAEQAGPIAKSRPRADDDDDDEGGMRLYDSLYQTALKQEIPKPIIDALVRVFANDVDFQRSVGGGDAIDVFFDQNDEGEARNELLYAAITTRDETFRFYRFASPDDGGVGYFDENGRSTDKFLIRKPVQAGELRSGFGMRYHPILRYYRPHTGVDWAGPIGTPIFAAGNGVVLKASWDSGGYGRRVEIQHANGYVTTYNHMSAFARGVAEGGRVRQGQVIGYLGSSGLSTGPHLHYEVMVNGHFVDPMRIKLSREKEFDARTLALFKRERDGIDGLLAKAPNAVGARVAQRP